MRSNLVLAGIALSLLSWSTTGLGIQARVGGAYGVMQQPTSQYYHLIYGAYADIASSEESAVLGRVMYFERPEFHAAGFTDQEKGLLVLAGTKVTKQKSMFSLQALAGGGSIEGRLEADDELDLPNRSYKIYGAAFGLEAAVRYLYLESAFGYQSFIGINSSEEVKTYVGWPFNLYCVRLGVYF